MHGSAYGLLKTPLLGAWVNRLSMDTLHLPKWHHACGGEGVASVHIQAAQEGESAQCPYSFCSGGKETPTSSLAPTIESLSIPFPASSLSACLTPVREATMRGDSRRVALKRRPSEDDGRP